MMAAGFDGSRGGPAAARNILCEPIETRLEVSASDQLILETETAMAIEGRNEVIVPRKNEL